MVLGRDNNALRKAPLKLSRQAVELHLNPLLHRNPAHSPTHAQNAQNALKQHYDAMTFE